MLTGYYESEGVLQRCDVAGRLPDAVWIDMVEPTREEEVAVEKILGIDVPSREEMQEVESSSQLYRDGDATIMTVRVLSVTNRVSPLVIAVTFILTPQRLVTLRYADSTSFHIFISRAEKESGCLKSSAVAMSGLLDAIVGRTADILEQIGDELDVISASLFTQTTEVSEGIVGADLDALLRNIGRNGDLASRSQDSLHSILRVIPVLQHLKDPAIAETVSTLHLDVKSLLDHAGFLSTKIQFLLDSALGLISIQQNAIIKIFSVAAVIFLPPTLIASVYGMNFQHIPELKWLYGYPFALGLMVVSAILPYWYFKRRRWL